MEIITMESAAYKELTAKIDLIAGYVRENEQSKKKDAAGGMDEQQGTQRAARYQHPHASTTAGQQAHQLRHLRGCLPLSRVGGGTAGQGKHLQLRRADG